MARAEAREVWVRGDAVEIAGALTGGEPVAGAAVVAGRRADGRELRVRASVDGSRFAARIELRALADADGEAGESHWDLALQADGGSGLPIGAPDDDVRNRHRAVRFPSRRLEVGSGARRRLRPGYTREGRLTIHSTPVASPATAAGSRTQRRSERHERPERHAPARWALALHRLATAAARLVVRLGADRGPATAGPSKASILLMSAWGMGGTIRTTHHLAAHLAERHDVELLSVVRQRDRPFFPLPTGVTVTAVDDRRPRRSRLPVRVARPLLRRVRSVLIHPAERAHQAGSLWTDLQLVRTLRRVRSGVLIGTRPALNLLIADVAAPGVATIGEEHMHLSAHPPAIRRAIERRYPRLGGLVVLTERDRRDYREVMPPSAPVAAIPNTVAPVDVPAAPLAAPTILAAGRLTPQKGFDRLIGAFAPVARQRPDWTLRICGSGPGLARLRRLVIEHELYNNVLLLGAVRNLDRQMASASMFVLSSRFEGLPMVLLEAMRIGLPVVAFDCPTGPREVIADGETGLLVEDGDEAALGDAMLRLIDDQALRRRFGAAGRDRVQARYTMDAVGPRWDVLIADAARGRAGP